MPSPTVMIRPTSEVTSSALKSFSRALMTSVMSPLPMLNFPFASPFCQPWSRGGELSPELLQPARDGGVGQPVADAEEEAAEDRGIDLRLQPDVLAQAPAQILAQALAVGLGEIYRSRHSRPDPASRRV